MWLWLAAREPKSGGAAGSNLSSEALSSLSHSAPIILYLRHTRNPPLHSILSTTEQLSLSKCMGQPPAFDVIVLGSGGGPCETNLSACVCHLFDIDYSTDLRYRYIVKPHEAPWEDGLLALEAGASIVTMRSKTPNSNSSQQARAWVPYASY